MGEVIVRTPVSVHAPVNVYMALVVSYMSCGDGTIRILILVRSAQGIVKIELYV